MSVNGVEIEVGQNWRTRDGKHVTVTEKFTGKAPYRTEIHDCFQIVVSASGWSYCVNEFGHYFEQGDPITGASAHDLVHLVSAPGVGVERRKVQTSNPPMRRAGDYPPVPNDLPDLAAPADEFAASMPGALGEAEPIPLAQPRSTTYTDAVREVLRPFNERTVTISGNPTPVPASVSAPKSALDVQVGGGHYKTFAIQPVEFIHRNNIGFIEGNAIKYLCRWREKGGVQDLEKVKHYIDLLIEMETRK
jgi:hypothetical protein